MRQGKNDHEKTHVLEALEMETCIFGAGEMVIGIFLRVTVTCAVLEEGKDIDVLLLAGENVLFSENVLLLPP